MPAVVADISFDFALSIISLYQNLIKEKEFVISKQLLKSGTSIGANIAEAKNAQSRKDFISKMCIAAKEARETKYWLMLLEKSSLVQIDLSGFLKDIETIICVLNKIIKSSRKNQAKSDVNSGNSVE